MQQPINCTSLLEVGPPRKIALADGARASAIPFMRELQMSTAVLSLDKASDDSSGLLLTCIVWFGAVLLILAVTLSSPELAETLSLLS